MTQTFFEDFVAGHRGMVGSAIVRRLEGLGYHDIITASRTELNLLDADDVHEFFRVNRPEQVYCCCPSGRHFGK